MRRRQPQMKIITKPGQIRGRGARNELQLIYLNGRKKE
jgi:hypothetical protein